MNLSSLTSKLPLVLGSFAAGFAYKAYTYSKQCLTHTVSNAFFSDYGQSLLTVWKEHSWKDLTPLMGFFEDKSVVQKLDFAQNIPPKIIQDLIKQELASCENTSIFGSFTSIYTKIDCHRLQGDCAYFEGYMNLAIITGSFLLLLVSMQKIYSLINNN